MLCSLEKPNKNGVLLNKKSSLLIVGLLLVLSLSWWVTSALVQKNLTHSLPKPNQPDTFISNVAYLETDEKGMPSNKLFAKTITHYPEQDKYVFSVPQLKIVSSANEHWQISAISGVSINKAHLINLSGQVNIKRFIDDAPQQTLTIKTKSLNFYPYKKYAETKDALTIDRLGSLVKAVGAKIDFNKSVLNLLSKVEGEYR